MSRPVLILVLAFMALGLLAGAGCTTLNKDECLQADWHGIGQEDGRRGYPVSRIGLHREACADFQVKPQLQAYQAGHAEGLREYCRPPVGYRLGLRAGHYAGVCPAALETEFVAAYEYGKSIYYLKRKLHKVDQRLNEAHQALQEVQAQIALKEDQLVAPDGVPEQRRALLREIRNLAFEKQELQSQLYKLRHHSQELAGNIEQLKVRSPYH